MNDSGSVAARSVVITGATSGIGRATAACSRAAPGVTVVVPARDTERGARRWHRKSADVALPLDLADLASVRAFPARARRRRPPAPPGPARQRRHPVHRPLAHHARRLRGDLRHQPPRPLPADPPAARPSRRRRPHHDRLQRHAQATSGVTNGGYPPPRWADARTLATPGEGGRKRPGRLRDLEAGERDRRPSSSSRRVDTLRPGSPHRRPRPRPRPRSPRPPSRATTRRVARRDLPRARPRARPRSPPSRRPPGAPPRTSPRTALDPSPAPRRARSPAGRWWEITKDGAPSAQARDPATGAQRCARERLVGLTPCAAARPQKPFSARRSNRRAVKRTWSR